MNKPISYVSILIILLMAAAFRLPNLERIPCWYWDEGVNLNIAWNLVNGKAIWFSLKYPFMPHPPLFFFAGGILLRLFGNELVVIRALSAFYGILTTILIYLLAREFFRERTALFSALLFAIYPVAIYWNRMAFANNQLTVLMLLAMYSFRRYLAKGKADGWLYLGSLSAGLAIITGMLGLSLLITIPLIIKPPRKRTKAVLLSLVLPALYIATMLFMMPSAFVHDTVFTLERFGITISSIALISVISVITYLLRNKVTEILIRLRNLYMGIAYESVLLPNESAGLTRNARKELSKRRLRSNALLFLILLNLILGATTLRPYNDEILFGGIDYISTGILGIFMVKKDVRKFILSFFLPLFLPISALTGRTDHLIIPLLPFFSMGLAVFLDKVYRYMNSLYDSPTYHLVVITLLAYPLIFVTLHDTSSFILGNNLIYEDIDSRIEAASFINSRAGRNDIVITDSHMVRFIECRTSVLLQSLAFRGIGVEYMSADYGYDRFEFNCSYLNARFIAITPGAIEWLSEKDMEMYLDVQRWPVHRVGRYLIYENPNLALENHVGGKPHPE